MTSPPARPSARRRLLSLLFVCVFFLLVAENNTEEGLVSFAFEASAAATMGAVNSPSSVLSLGGGGRIGLSQGVVVHGSRSLKADHTFVRKEQLSSSGDGNHRGGNGSSGDDINSSGNGGAGSGMDSSDGRLTFSHRSLSSTCLSGRTYEIMSVESLQKELLKELPCIFSAGISPSVIPLGALYATLLYPVVPQWINRFVYQGHWVSKTMCRGKTTYVDQMSALGIKFSASPIEIGVPEGSFQDGEFYDGRPTILTDVTTHMKDVCEGDNLPFWEGIHAKGFLPFQELQVPPGLVFNDLLRVVGVDRSDGGTIFLQRSLARDLTKADNRWATAAYVAMKSFDPRLLGNRQFHTDPIRIGPTAFSFSTPLIADISLLVYRFLLTFLLYSLTL